MRATTLIISILVLGATAVCAETFNPARYLADPEVDVLTRNVANEQFGRDLFGDPYATVVVGNVDVYDRFPYLEARYFQIVSDPSWNRLLMGEMGRGLAAYDGAESGFGRLTGPRGLSSDGLGHVYVADTGNDRVLVFRTISEFDRIELEPMYAIEGLAKPFDVAYSDGGTPFDARDDRLYVANTGRNEVKLYEIANNRPKLVHTIGELGSGTERFAGPMAITVGRRDGAHGSDIYVSDAHNQRLVHLRDTGSRNFRGVPGPVRVFELLRAGPLEARMDVERVHGLTFQVPQVDTSRHPTFRRAEIKGHACPDIAVSECLGAVYAPAIVNGPVRSRWFM